MSFGLSITDIAEISKFAFNLYQSCKNAGTEFTAVSNDVNSLQAAIQKLHDELKNPTSGFFRVTGTDRIELNKLIQRCHTDLKEVNQQLEKYRSLKTKTPRTRDRIGFSSSKVQEIQKRLAKNRDDLNFQLIQVNTTTLHRVESSTQANSSILSRIEAKLDLMINAIAEKQKQPNEDLHISAKELLDDGITEADLVENKKQILELLDKVQEEQQPHSWEVTEGEGSSALSRESLQAPTAFPSQTGGTRDSKLYQATVEEIDEEQSKIKPTNATQDIEQEWSEPSKVPVTNCSSKSNNDCRKQHSENSQGPQSTERSYEYKHMANVTNESAPMGSPISGGRRIHLDFSRISPNDATVKKIPVRGRGLKEIKAEIRQLQSELYPGKPLDPEIQNASPGYPHGQQLFEEWLNELITSTWNEIAQRAQIKQPHGTPDDNEIYEDRDQISDDAFNFVQFFVSPSGITYHNSQTDDNFYPDGTYGPFPENFWFAGMEAWIVGRPSCPLNPRHPRHNLVVNSAQNDSSEPKVDEIAEEQSASSPPLQSDEGVDSKSESDIEPDPNPEHEPGEFGESKSDTESESDTEPTVYQRPLACTLEELFHGATKKLRIKAMGYDDVMKCYAMQEQIISVEVKRGLLPGAEVRYEELCFIIEQKPHRHFRMGGTDIYFRVDVREADFDDEWQHTVLLIDETPLSITRKSGIWHECERQEGDDKNHEWQVSYDDLGMFRSTDSVDRGRFIVNVCIL